MSATILRVERLAYARSADCPVLQECSFDLAAGERAGLVGDNGSGKTTLLWLLVGLLPPGAGAIWLFGKRVAVEADFAPLRGRIGLLFQDADDQLFCPTVAEDVAFGPLNLGRSRAATETIVAETLDRLGLAGYEDRLTTRLSGGEKRLVALATVLAMEPEILLLDEPTAGLDGKAIERVVEVLAGLPQAMLIVSHDRAFLQRLGARVLSLEDGRIKAVQE